LLIALGDDLTAPVLDQPSLYLRKSETQEPAVQLITRQPAAQQRVEGGLPDAEFLL
jgi:hypothetical protein